MTKAVIWDFDGTLGKRSGRWSDTLVEILDTESPGHGVTASSLMPGLARGFPWHNPERAHPELADPDIWWEHLLGVLRGALASVGVAGSLADLVLARARFEYTRLDRWSLFPDAIPALDRLRGAGWRQAILSNHYPELPDIVRGLGIWDYFEVVLSSAAIGFEKPNSQAIACVIEDLGHPEMAWMIGDNPEADIAGAARCGIPGVLVRQSLPGLECAPDLMAAVELIEQREADRLGGTEQEMVRYYSARADQYDDWYLRRGRYSHGASNDGAWKADLDAAAAWLDARPFRGRIAELAAGTGWWSPSLARKGELTLYDAAREPLAKAATRLADAGLKVQAQVRDAWAEPDRIVDGLFTGFWLSHIDRARLDQFFGLVDRWLAPGGLFAFIDSRQDPESGAVDHRPPEVDIQVRKLDDGTSFCVRKVFYEPADLAAALARAGFTDIEVATTDRFFVLGSARRPEGGSAFTRSRS
jgi:putative hydrolase of the HAD superfamily